MSDIIPGHRSREEFLRLLWDDIAILKLMREVPFRRIGTTIMEFNLLCSIT